MKPLARILIDTPRQRLSRAGHNVPAAVLLLVYLQLAVVALLILYLLYRLAVRFDQGGSELDILL